MSEAEVKSLNRKYKDYIKEQKQFGLTGKDFSFKQWVNNVFNNADKEKKDTNPNAPSNFNNKVKIHIFGMNLWAFGGIVIGITAVAIIAGYIIKQNKQKQIALATA